MPRYQDKSKRGKTHPMEAPRTHENCKEIYGVCRPGKTAADRKRRSS